MIQCKLNKYAYTQASRPAGRQAGTHVVSRIMSEALLHPWSIVRTIHLKSSTETTKREKKTHIHSHSKAHTHMKSVFNLSFCLFHFLSCTHTHAYIHFKSLFRNCEHTHKTASNWHYCTIQSRANFLYFIPFGMVCNSIVLSFDSRSSHVNPTHIIGSIFFIFQLSCGSCTLVWPTHTHTAIPTIQLKRKWELVQFFLRASSFSSCFLSTKFKNVKITMQKS